MIEIANIENSSVVEINIKDKFTKEDIQEIDSFFINEIGDEEEVNLLLLMNDWKGMTFKGLIEDFKMIKHIKNMNKAAIVANSKLLKMDSKLEDLFPGLRVKHFETEERDVAKRWLKD